MIPMYTKTDVDNLTRRVRARLSTQPTLTPGPAAAPPEVVACAECVATDHGHKAKQVGAYRECLCLDCPTLVIGPWIVFE